MRVDSVWFGNHIFFGLLGGKKNQSRLMSAWLSTRKARAALWREGRARALQPQCHSGTAKDECEGLGAQRSQAGDGGKKTPVVEGS